MSVLERQRTEQRSAWPLFFTTCAGLGATIGVVVAMVTTAPPLAVPGPVSTRGTLAPSPVPATAQANRRVAATGAVQVPGTRVILESPVSKSQVRATTRPTAAAGLSTTPTTIVVTTTTPKPDKTRGTTSSPPVIQPSTIPASVNPTETIHP